jgi:flagellar biogenesis protein FliO
MFLSVLECVPDLSEESADLIAGNLALQASTELPPGDYGASFAKMFLVLISLVLLFGLTIWFLRRLIRQRLERGTGAQMIHVLEKKMISPKTMLYVIEHEGKKILLAESQLEIRTISSSQLRETD